MTVALSIIFRIVEPMMFRGSGEFDPFVRGTYSRAVTLAMPSPSTVAGTIATYCISELGRTIPSSGDWLDQYLSVLGEDVKIRGPFIKINQQLMAEDRLARAFLTMDEIRKKCEKERGKLKLNLSSLTQLDEYPKRDEFEPSFKVEKDVRVGIGLQAREKVPMKSVKKDFLYSAEYLNYHITARSESDEENSIDIEIIAEMRGRLTESLLSARELPVKFGGENRVALFSVDQGEKILDEIKRRLWYGQEKHTGILALYLATPALFKGGVRVEEYLRRWAEGINSTLAGLSGESAVLGAGFRISEGRRKPIYTSLSPGSIIFLKGSFDLLKIYRDEALGEASMLGYGTHIPIPIVNNT